MNIDNDLKKDGIKVIKPVDTLTVTLISKFVAEKFISYFPFYSLQYNDIFIKISRLPMYFAEIPNGMSEANYFYKNSSIYFRNGISIEDMKKLTIHEFIHHYQELKDKKNILYRLGLCDYTGMKIHGLALNEGAVQLISSKILRNEEDTVKYYGIEFSTISPSFYPIICNLVNQMAYITGEQVFFDSTLYSNNKFKNTFIKLCGEKVFYKVENNLDKIIKAEEKIILCTSKLQKDEINEKQIAKASTQIGICKKIIQDTFVQTQNMILTSYFNNSINNIYSLQDIEDYRKKLYFYKDLLGVTEGYTFFNDYYINIMTKLDNVYEVITGSTSLVPYNRNLFQILFSKISSLFKTNAYQYKVEK